MAVRKLTLIPLIFLIYFEVAGGPFGEEPAVQAAGPLISILGFLIFPFIWAIPEALITAELCTAFPGHGGYVTWVSAAFNPFWASMTANWKYLTGVINLAAFPILCLDYFDKIFPVFDHRLARKLMIPLSVLFLSLFNHIGIAVVGYITVAFGLLSLLPFIIMSAIAIPQIHPQRWVSLGQHGVKKNWTLFFNTLFWNLNFWDSVSTLAGEVHKPNRTFPLALLFAVILTCFAYLVPLMAVIGALELKQNQWQNGYMSLAAEEIAGKWLRLWIEIGAVLSGVALFQAQVSSVAYQLTGMSELGLLPKFFEKRSWFDTPWVAILVSTAIIIGMTFLNFANIVATANFLYCLGMFMEFGSFIKLRWKFPRMRRPYRVPFRISGLIVMCIVPSAFMVLIIVVATKVVYLIGGLMTLGAVGLFFLVKLCKNKNWLEFSEENAGHFEEEM